MALGEITPRKKDKKKFIREENFHRHHKSYREKGFHRV